MLRWCALHCERPSGLCGRSDAGGQIPVNNLAQLNSAFVDGSTCYALTTANVGQECPYCFSVDGFKVLGEVAPLTTKTEEKVEVGDDVKESLKNNKIVLAME